MPDFKIVLRESSEEECKIPYTYLERSDLLTLLEFCCILDIEINGKLFFSEGICPLEFRYQLSSWLNNLNADKNFYYVTEDDSNNPVLELRFLNGAWNIYSIFQKFKCVLKLSKEDIIEFTEQFNREILRFIIC